MDHEELTSKKISNKSEVDQLETLKKYPLAPYLHPVMKIPLKKGVANLANPL